MKKTIVIQIGNSDNKLPQAEWSKFAWSVRDFLNGIGVIHFFGCSSSTDPWQNCCIIAEVLAADVSSIKAHLSFIRREYKQDSVAFLAGKTHFI